MAGTDEYREQCGTAASKSMAPGMPDMQRQLDRLDRLDMQACQLNALLIMSTNCAFNELAAYLRTDYLWACSRLAQSIVDDLQGLVGQMDNQGGVA